MKPAAVKRFRRSEEALEPSRSGSILGLSPSGHHRIHYVERGPTHDPRPIVCVHGLTRQGRDFDYLAAKLAASGRRVICPDLPGRGLSDWLANPDDYALPQYCADMNTLLARLNVDAVDWVGTSLGGLIGIILAGMAKSPIKRLLINDIGPYVSSSGLKRISGYIRNMPERFETFDEAEAYFRSVLAPYGHMSDAHWARLVRYSIRENTVDRMYEMLCDSRIRKAFSSPWLASLDLWKYWDQVTVKTLVLHGAKSDLLTDDITAQMINRNGNARIVRFDDCGHVPPLVEPYQIDIVSDFLADR